MSDISLDISVKGIDLACVNLEITVNDCRYHLSRESCSPCGQSGHAAVPDFASLLEDYAAAFGVAGRHCTARNYSVAAACVRRFSGARLIGWEEITPDFVAALRQYMVARGLVANTVGLYMRVLRAAYNKAVHQYGLVNGHPFVGVDTAICRTAKRALTLDAIRRIRRCRPADTAVRMARDMFLFSFFACGMPFVDMAYLRRTNVSGDLLHYSRHKTGQPVAVRWNATLQDIVDANPPMCDPYLLPLITRANGKERSQYRRKQQMVNECLKAVAREAGIGGNLTLYVARHSWASIATDMGARLEDVSQALGHTNQRTTRIYVNSLAQDRLAAVNNEILACL